MTQIKIGGIPYTITKVDTFEEVPHEPDSEEPLWGETDFSEASIKFVKSSPARELRVFWHEVIHAIIQEYAIRELQDKKGVHIEFAIDQLAAGVSEVLEGLGVDLPL